jgi:hypothetical protein
MPPKTVAEQTTAAALGKTQLSPPSYLQPKRSAARPSTPKGVGRCAPLTACLRGAKLAGRSAGRDSGDTRGKTSRGGLSYGLGCERSCDPGVRSHLAFLCGWGRFWFPDHNRTRSRKQPGAVLGVRLWSGNQKRHVAGCGGVCERRAVRAGGRVGNKGGRDWGESKRWRNEGWLRLGCGWWSR